MRDEVCQQDVEFASSEELALIRSTCGAQCHWDRAHRHARRVVNR